MLSYIIVCPMVFLAGLVDAIAGGGGLISLPAYMLAGVPAHMALATNKMSSTMGTVVSTARYAKNGYIRLKLAAVAVICAITGSFAGSKLVLLVDEKWVGRLMLIVLPVVAFYVLKNKNLGNNEETDTLPEKKIWFITVMASLLIGMYDGFYGPGTGTFLLLILTGIGRMNIREASGLTKAINLSSNATALAVFLISGKVLLSLGLTAGIFSIAGHYIGSGLMVTGGQKVARPVVLIVLAMLFVKILVN